MTQETHNSAENLVFPHTVGEEFSVFTSNSFGTNELVFSYQEHLNLQSFNQGKKVIVPKLEMRNSRQFSYTNRGVNERYSDPKVVNSLIRETSNVEILNYLQQLQTAKSLEPVNPVDLPELGYQGGVVTYRPQVYEWRDIFQGTVNMISQMKRKGAYGKLQGVTYFSVDDVLALNHAKANKKTNILFLTIDLKKLALKRNIFIDPESLLITNEFQRNFVVHAGIPVSAIISADVLEFRGMSEKKRP